MEAKILTTNLQKALGAVERLAKKNLSLPVLSNVLIEADKSFLKLTSTNLETSMVWWVLAKIAKKGRGAFPAGFLSNLVRLVTTKTINLSIMNKNLTLTANDQEFQIQGVYPDDFPIVPKINKKDKIQIKRQQMAQALSQVVDIPAMSQVRPEISGIYFQIKDKQLKIAATDSFRLAEKTISLADKPAKQGSFILPQNSARELLNVLSLIEVPMELFFDPDQVLFEWQREDAGHAYAEIFSRQVTGQYPNYKEIIPKEAKIEVVLKRKQFLNQIKKAGLFSGQVAEVKLSLVPEENKLKMFSQTAEIGKSQGLIKTESIKGGSEAITALETSFNYKYLEDGLKNIQASEVALQFVDSDHPCLLRGVGDKTYFYILMPIKNQ